MRELTFKGFLKQYVYSMSSNKTYGLYKLAHEAAATNPRLREPLLLFALFTGKEKVLLQATKDAMLKEEYTNLLKVYSKHQMEEALANNSPELPERYLRVYVSYTRLMMRKNNNRHMKELLYARIRQLQEDKGISNYRLYTGLKLNPSNVNAFLKTGNPRKISQGIANKLLSYLEIAHKVS